MEIIEVFFKKCSHFDPDFSLPSYATSGSCGADLQACLTETKQITLKPFERVLIPTGLMMELPKGFEAQIRPRSGLSLRTGLMVVNSPGTIDADYRGEVKIIMANISDKEEIINHGDRIAQMIIKPVTLAHFRFKEEISETARGTGGFGSTGGISVEENSCH